MSVFSQTPGELDIEAVLGTDFALSLNFANGISNYTFDAGIVLQEYPSEIIFPITTSISGTNLVNLTLSDTQTNEIGVISNKKWYLNRTKDGIKQMVLSGRFQISSVPVGQNPGVIEYVMINDITVSSLYAVGAHGATGSTGVQGSTGPVGATGLTGSTGEAGATGPQGATGIGATGLTGSTGPEGATGLQGATGLSGSNGATGATGLTGSTGPEGATGLRGSTGLSGSNGATGATGPQGATGVTGSTGVQGNSGNIGATGSTGPAGATGQGVRILGSVPAFVNLPGNPSLGDIYIVTNENGVAYSWNGSYWNNIGYINGATGATGISGSNGATGSTGPAGATGIPGTAAAQGATGATGPEGATGSGSTGATGQAGATGATGQIGATGFGATGLTGATGSNGYTNAFYGYAADTTKTSGFPTSGTLYWNNATQTSATQVAVSHITANSEDIDLFLSFLATSNQFVIQEKSDSNSFQKWTVSGTPTNVSNSYIELPVTLVDSAGNGSSNFANTTNLLFILTQAGIQGSTGVQGATGSQGATGATGLTGATGSGSTGATGIAGPEGATGFTGDAGATGEQGATGPQGNTGATGLTGATGSVGATGAVGSNGATGATGAIPSNTDLTVNGLTVGRGGGNRDTNTTFGNNALASNTLGGSNVTIGQNALYNNTLGSNNVSVGNNSLQQNTNQDDNVAIGYYSLNQTTSTRNTAIGREALRYITTGTDNSGIGYRALYSSDPGVRTFSNCSGIGANSAITASNQVQLGDSSTTTYVYGTVQNRSDARDKKDVKDTELGLDFIKALRPVDFKWDLREDYKTEENNDLSSITADGSKKRSRFHHGLIAQEVKAVLEAKGIDFGGFQDHSICGGKDVLSIGYDELIAPLIKAVQELSTELTIVKQELNALKQ